MKWTHPNHQLDHIAAQLKPFEKIYIFGAGETGKSVYKSLLFLGLEIEFIDNDKKKASAVDGCNVISMDEYEKSRIEKEHIVVFAMRRYSYLELMKSFWRLGYLENRDFFYHDVFFKYYLNIVGSYFFEKIYINQISQMVTDYCSLRCRDCCMSIPYLKKHHVFTLEKLENDTDLLFKRVDYIQYWGPGGGEIFLFPQLGEFVDYVMRRYRKQIGEILLITNGTVIPTDETLSIIAKHQLEIKISDYSLVPGWKEKKDKFVNKLRRFGISYLERKMDHWIDMWGRNKNILPTIMDKRASEQFDRCDNTCREYFDGRLYYCMHGRYENLSKEQEEVEGLDFRDKDTTKKMIMEYNLGFLKNGYYEICGCCNGYFGINHNMIEVAEQI